MGPCAVVEAEGVTILLTSRKMPPWDLGQFRSQRIEPDGVSASSESRLQSGTVRHTIPSSRRATPC